MNKEARVGLFIVMAITILFYLSINIGALRLFSNSYFIYKTYFEDVIGLEVKSPVKISGINVGWVESIVLTDKGKAEVSIRVSRDHKLFKNSYATITQDSLLGNKILEVDSGDSSSGLLPPGSALHLPGRSSASLNEILEGVKDITNSVQDVAHTFNRVFSTSTGEERMKKSLEDISKASFNVANFTGRLDDFMLQNNDNLQNTTKNLNKGIASFSEFMPDVKNTFAGVKDNFELAILDAKTAAKNTAMATKIAREIGQKIEKGEGTVGKLINEEEIYDGVKDAVEGINSFLGKAKKLEISIDAHQEQFRRVKNSRGELNINLKFTDDYFYIVQLVTDNIGKKREEIFYTDFYKEDGVTAIDRNANTVGINNSDRTLSMNGYGLTQTAPKKTVTMFDKNALKIGFQVAKKFNRITLRAGKFEDNFGCAVDFDVPLRSTNMRWITTVEAFDFSGFNRLNDDRPHVKWTNKALLFKNVYSYFGIDDLFSRKSAAPFWGFGITFYDDDLKFLLYSLMGKATV